jgi:5'-nucleotidase
LLNVNVPDVPLADLQGYRATRLGQRHKSEPVVKQRDPRGRSIYWIGPPGAEQDAGPGTDFHAVGMGYVSITPLQLDLTWFDRINMVRNWLSEEVFA